MYIFVLDNDVCVKMVFWYLFKLYVLYERLLFKKNLIIFVVKLFYLLGEIIIFRN